MKDNKDLTLINAINSINELNDKLKYIFLSDIALSNAILDNTLVLTDSEINGMSCTKNTLMNEYEELRQHLEIMFTNGLK